MKPKSTQDQKKKKNQKTLEYIPDKEEAEELSKRIGLDNPTQDLESTMDEIAKESSPVTRQDIEETVEIIKEGQRIREDLGLVREEILKEFDAEDFIEYRDGDNIEPSTYFDKPKMYKFVEQALAKVAEQAALEAKKEVIGKIREGIEVIFDGCRSSNQNINGKRRFGIPSRMKINARHLYKIIIDKLAKEEKK